MANQVYANLMEVSCKAANGKTVAAMPDTCMTPPPPPGVPVPYPNTGLASDCTEGSTTVQISGQEVMLKNKSYFKRSSGDEAGCAPKKGVMTGQIQGKCYFNSWSMDVLIEGENVVRHLDLTTHNHASFVGNSPAWPYVDETAMKQDGACHADVEREKDKCKDCKPHKENGKDPCTVLGDSKPPYGKDITAAMSVPVADQMAEAAALDECLSARKCLLQPYKPTKKQVKNNEALGCCYPQTGHHLIEKSAFFEKNGARQLATFPLSAAPEDKPWLKYDENMAPCVCAEGTSHNRGGSHELMHAFQLANNLACPKGTLPVGTGADAENIEFPHVTTYGQAKNSAMEAHRNVFASSGCNEECLKEQLDAYHKQCGIEDSTQIKAVTESISPRISKSVADQVSKARALRVEAMRAARALTRAPE